MPDENTVRDVAEAVKGIVEAVPVYEDVVQPAAQEVGIALQTVAKTIHIVLAPISALVWGYDQIKDFVSTRVAERLKNVPPSEICTPKPNVAGPALEALRYTGHEESLRDLYANLLATAMDARTANEAHPAFVEIIRQLTPDEAKIVKQFALNRAFPLLNVRWDYAEQTDEHRGGQELLTHFSLLGEEAGCEFPQFTPSYLDNICRLGLAEIPPFFEYTSSGVYDELENHPRVVEVKQAIELNPDLTLSVNRVGLRITQLGRLFCKACVVDHDSLDGPLADES